MRWSPRSTPGREDARLERFRRGPQPSSTLSSPGQCCDHRVFPPCARPPVAGRGARPTRVARGLTPASRLRDCRRLLGRPGSMHGPGRAVAFGSTATGPAAVWVRARGGSSVQTGNPGRHVEARQRVEVGRGFQSRARRCSARAAVTSFRSASSPDPVPDATNIPGIVTTTTPCAARRPTYGPHRREMLGRWLFLS